MNSNFVLFIIVFFLLHVYLCMDLWRIWLQHLRNHYKTALSTIRETFVYTAARIWERTTRRDFVCTRQISPWSTCLHRATRVGIYTVGLPNLAMWTLLVELSFRISHSQKYVDVLWEKSCTLLHTGSW